MNGPDAVLASTVAAAIGRGHHLRIPALVLGLAVLAALGYGVFRIVEQRRARRRPPSEDIWPAKPAPGVGMQQGPPDRVATEAAGAAALAETPPAAPLPPIPPTSPSPSIPAASLRWAGSGNHEWAVETNGLTKRFGQNVAVNNVDLRVPRGSAFGYLGPNGAGKTTLIRTLLGLTSADGGTMALFGIPVPKERSRALARVGAIVDEPRFYSHLTGRENLRLIAAGRGASAEARIEPGLERVGLTGRADDKVAAYSMGMRQRLGVATCLLGDPDLLILDEPMNGLDPAGMHEMRYMIRSLVDEGRTVMLSSHLLDEVERTCDAVAIVDRGTVIRQGPISELVRGANVVVQVVCSDPPTAVRIVEESGLPTNIASNELGMTITLPAGAPRDMVAEVNRRLVEGGIAVYSLQEVRASLEDWFLSVTSRFGGPQ